MTIREFIHELKRYSGDSEIVLQTLVDQILFNLKEGTGKPPKPGEMCLGCGMIPRGWITQKELLWAIGNRPCIEKIFETSVGQVMYIFSDRKKAEAVAKELFTDSHIVIFPVILGQLAGAETKLDTLQKMVVHTARKPSGKADAWPSEKPKRIRLFCEHPGCLKFIRGTMDPSSGYFDEESTGETCDLRNQVFYCEEHSTKSVGKKVGE